METYPNLAKLRILHYPDRVLRAVASPVPEVNRFLDEMSARMAELLAEAQGLGLAATQVGWPFRFVVLHPDEASTTAQAFINPVIIARDGKQVEEEGCLSVPGLFAKVKRAQRVRVRAQLPNGETVELNAEGLYARLWQHEIDHMDGSLFIDRLGPTARIMLAGRLQEMEASARETDAAEAL